jgi:hypothetical protein
MLFGGREVFGGGVGGARGWVWKLMRRVPSDSGSDGKQKG